MPRIIPIRELKNTNNISELCRSTNEPIFVTKNGYGELVVMSMETYEAQLRRLEFYQELAISEKQFEEGKNKRCQSFAVRCEGKVCTINS